MAAFAPDIPDPPRALPATEVLIGRIGWLIRLRWVAIAGTALFLEGVSRHLPLQLEHGVLHTLLAALAVHNLAMGLLLRRVRQRGRAPLEAHGTGRIGPLASFLLPRTGGGTRLPDRAAADAAAFALVQIVVDLLFLAALLHFTGGLENPLWVFFVFHVIVASVLLSRRATYAVASLGTLLLWSMVLLEQAGILPRHSLEVLGRTDWYADPRLVGTYLAAQAVTLFVAAYLASSVAGRLRRREADVMVLSWHLSDKAHELERTCAELSRAEHAKSLYLRKVAHELRAPLGTIKTALTLVLDTSAEAMSAQTRHLIERAERRLGELADMTQSLLALSRAQGGQTVTEFGPVPLSPLLHRVLEEMDARAAAASLQLRIALPPALPVVLADGEALADLVENLLGNAIRYTPAGGTVSVAVEVVDGAVSLVVRDTGIGIAADALPRIFDEFYRTPAAREHTSEGAGLGLAIVKAVVEQHGGHIEVQSEAGKGTEFRVGLPLRILPEVWQEA